MIAAITPNAMIVPTNGIISSFVIIAVYEMLEQNQWREPHERQAQYFHNHQANDDADFAHFFVRLSMTQNVMRPRNMAPTTAN